MNDVAAVPLNVTEVAPVKLVPLMVTSVPTNPEFAELKGNPEYEDIVKKARQPRG